MWPRRGKRCCTHLKSSKETKRLSRLRSTRMAREFASKKLRAKDSASAESASSTVQAALDAEKGKADFLVGLLRSSRSSRAPYLWLRPLERSSLPHQRLQHTPQHITASLFFITKTMAFRARPGTRPIKSMAEKSKEQRAAPGWSDRKSKRNARHHVVLGMPRPLARGQSQPHASRARMRALLLHAVHRHRRHQHLSLLSHLSSPRITRQNFSGQLCASADAARCLLQQLTLDNRAAYALCVILLL